MDVNNQQIWKSKNLQADITLSKENKNLQADEALMKEKTYLTRPKLQHD